MSFIFIVDTNGIVIDKVEEVFLDQILFDIQKMDQNKCLSIGKQKLKNFHLKFYLILFNSELWFAIVRTLVSFSRTIGHSSSNIIINYQ